MLGITRDSRIGMAQFGQLGASIRASVAPITDSPPSIGADSGLQAYHHSASRARIIAGRAFKRDIDAGFSGSGNARSPALAGAWRRTGLGHVRRRQRNLATPSLFRE